MNRIVAAPSLRALVILSFLLGLTCSGHVLANVRLPAILGDNMVLQGGDWVPLWGWADPNEEIEIRMSWSRAVPRIQAEQDGTWTFRVAAPDFGGPYEITFQGKNTVSVKNILVGEVWVCSGQSNMQMDVRSSARAEQEIAAARYPKIRLFSVKRMVADTPQSDCEGSWVECSPETIPGFSATAYFFGRRLHRDLDLPIGLIHTSWGGTPAEAWTSDTMLRADPEFAPILKRYEDAVANYPQAMVQYKEKLQKWEQDAEKAKAEGRSAPPRPYAPLGPGHPHAPSGLYNAMIAPLIPYAIRGAIWYQGESNAGRAYQYRSLFPAMIRSWWQAWGRGDFPFLFVQLANYMKVTEEPCESEWAELREAQLMTLSLPNTGMAVIIDIGEADDIHPKNKQDVGERLALWALARTYMKDVVYSGPLYSFMNTRGSEVVLHFQHVDGGLVAKGGEPLKGFAIAGEDRRFVWADARIEGETVVVHSDKVPEPVAVRYAWANNPICNLYNKAGLPASPFRTDGWPGLTVDKK
ncbi:MAG TPA: sialate O-acetylesterase [Sedimentisphaerales bacterium]|nr:sialate O-acetylesterase [Sedimentisphaerales bacterium]HRS11636.1 sialate O-acetylesterase [Sedimentisphaerales bacterium]HRV48299.1 sialate O-acetylesterase [Sedimentisphaerales bacterium]